MKSPQTRPEPAPHPPPHPRQGDQRGDEAQRTDFVFGEFHGPRCPRPGGPYRAKFADIMKKRAALLGSPVGVQTPLSDGREPQSSQRSQGRGFGRRLRPGTGRTPGARVLSRKKSVPSRPSPGAYLASPPLRALRFDPFSVCSVVAESVPCVLCGYRAVLSRRGTPGSRAASRPRAARPCPCSAPRPGWCASTRCRARSRSR